MASNETSGTLTVSSAKPASPFEPAMHMATTVQQMYGHDWKHARHKPYILVCSKRHAIQLESRMHSQQSNRSECSMHSPIHQQPADAVGLVVPQLQVLRTDNGVNLLHRRPAVVTSARSSTLGKDSADKQTRHELECFWRRSPLDVADFAFGFRRFLALAEGRQGRWSAHVGNVRKHFPRAIFVRLQRISIYMNNT